ncbi:TraB/GumN family protein [Hyphomicrobium sp.]|uniref:TraB/GumN family protein n=1 Tax=Hyphomicrobium sp. TaxID=82 RepID=UPI002E31CCD8|nr:TraB/GumN family protein [Hyphomicrobium sp.]HEX2840576.1 TraB/GumN family protein [Hyphomicrobium sp.]
MFRSGRSIGLWLIAVLFIASTHRPATSQEAPETSQTRCTGKNLLDKLSATDPALHARIVENANALENGQAIFWKLERPGSPPSYLFGTVHLTDNRIKRLRDTTKNAIRASKTLLIENANLSPEATGRAYVAAAESAVFTDGRTLDSLLSKEEFDQVRKSAGESVPADALRLYRPWIVSLMIAASDCERRRVQSGYRVLDMALAERAQVNGIPVGGLETTEDQLTALASIPDDEQLGILRANIALIDENENLRETMVQLYLRRRIGALWDLQLALAEKAGVPASAYASFQKTLIVDRNRKMREAALPHLEKGGAFIAVGALHLPGKTGLVELFREAGYTATAIE